MTTTQKLNKFIEKVRKLDNYYILCEKEDYLILGTNIPSNASGRYHYNGFYQADKRKAPVPTFFLVTLQNSALEITQIFTANRWAILHVHEPQLSYKSIDVKKLIDGFVVEKIVKLY